MNINIVVVVGVILALFVVGIVSYIALSEGMGYSQPDFVRGVGTEKDCSTPCSCMPKGVSCDKGTEYCYRKGKYYDRGQYCGEVCTGCGQDASYNVSQPAISAYSVDVTLAKSGSLPFTTPFGVGRPPIVYPYTF